MRTLTQNAKQRQMAADKRRLTQIRTSCLSAFICVHLRPSIVFTACALVLASTAFAQRGKPVILVPVYYRCPMLCTQILNGLASSLKAVSLVPGKDFEIVAVSFDPKDTPETAAGKKQLYMRRYGRPDTANGWHLLTGDQANISALLDAIGYHYKYVALRGQFAHASGIMVLTPEGRLS